MTAFYSEFDPKAAAWLRELIKQGHIADGIVDERDLWDVSPADLASFTQVHLCAGIGVWSYALRRAGWPDDRPAWTASFPCQPFSAAGKGEGFADERHLWPAGQYLAEQCRPGIFFGEQVASKDAEPWLELVQSDMEALGYAFGACAFPSAGIGAPHIRDRTYWVAESADQRHERAGVARGRRDGFANFGAIGSVEHSESDGRIERRAEPGGRGAAARRGDGGLADDDARLEGRGQPGCERAAERPAGAGGVAGGLAFSEDVRRVDGEPGSSGGAGRAAQGSGELARDREFAVADAGNTSGLAFPDGRHPGAERQQRGREQRQQPQDGGAGSVADTSSIGRLGRQGLPAGRIDERSNAGRVEDHDGPVRLGEAGDARSDPGPVNGLWRDADWLFCRDGKWRPVEPGTFPLAHGAPARVGRLRGYGNAINAEAAIAWIESYLEAIGERAFAAGGAEEASAVR